MRIKVSPRPATEEDLEKVAGIEKALIQPPWNLDAFRAEIGKKHSEFWVLTDDETDSKIFAYIVFSFPAEQAHIQTFAVNPEYSRQGHGKHMLRFVISYVMRNNGESIALEVRKSNKAAVQLYQDTGFIIIHTVKNSYPDGEDAYSMIYKTDRKKLTGESDEDFDVNEGDGIARRKADLN
jgi:ribosomal-protein-alanine acetyltransferase